MMEQLQQIQQYADKVCQGSKLAKIFILIEICLGVILFFALGTDFISGSIEFYALKWFPSKLIPFFGIVNIHYGICLYLYASVPFLLVVVTILIAWLAKKWKQKRERDAILNQIVAERLNASSAS